MKSKIKGVHRRRTGVRKSISTSYFYSTAVLLLCGITVMGFVQMYLATGYFRIENSNALLSSIDNVTDILNYYDMLDSEDALSENAKKLSENEAGTAAREIRVTARATDKTIFIVNREGKILLTNTASESSTTHLPQKILNEAYASGVYAGNTTLAGYFPSRYYVAGKPALLANGELAGFVFAAADATGLDEYIANLFSTFILSAGLMLIVSSVLSLVFTSRLTTPLRRISEAANNFGKGDFSARVPVQGDDELAQLTETFNTMANSLEKIDLSRRSFMGNIAHELRTPMTSVKGFIDGMLDGTIPAENYDHYLGIVSEEVGRLTRLIKNMLDITKLESGEYQVDAKLYDIWESITGVVFADEQRIEANSIQIGGFAPSKTLVYADPDLVYQVVYNLVDNALKFCGEGGEVRFSVTSAKDFVTVRVRNTGEGIAREALPFVFDRFYKEDKSRGVHAMGSGLGLHICKVLINLSGGTIWAESEQNSYCEFSFTLPTAAPAAAKAEEKKADSQAEHL